QVPDVDRRAELVELDGAMKCQDHSGEPAGEQQDRQGPGTEAVHLPEEVAGVERPREDESRGALAEHEIVADADGRSQEPLVDTGHEPFHPLPPGCVPPLYNPPWRG